LAQNARTSLAHALSANFNAHVAKRNASIAKHSSARPQPARQAKACYVGQGWGVGGALRGLKFLAHDIHIAAHPRLNRGWIFAIYASDRHALRKRFNKARANVSHIPAAKRTKANP
jgi:hypothetical protein